ncbi:hypothetical protein GRF29_213g553216 [Pseudopithomyces chartarum]|uniref:Uncharacterized protein n=1 Tax=Pseudopithomyces chartarum TaxID=1892770 RepID=A0AAN6RC20_9PLEO|nr:hypothetical protein GRF29_213g553216 [Pseudopithomyces chartarum]
MPIFSRSRTGLTAEENRQNRRSRVCIIAAAIFIIIGIVWIGVVFLVAFPTKAKHPYTLHARQYDGETPAFNMPIVQQLDQDADGMPDQPLVWSVENSLVDPFALGYASNMAHDGGDIRQEEYAALLRSGFPRGHGKAYHGVLDLKTTARSVSDEPVHDLGQTVDPPSLDTLSADGKPVPEGEKSGQGPYAEWLASYLPKLPGFSFEPSQGPDPPQTYAAWLASYLPTPPGFTFQSSNSPPTTGSSSKILPKEKRSNEPRVPHRPFAEAIRCTECDISPRRYCNDYWGQR